MQSVLEKAIGEATSADVQVAGSGRTDAGAHALGQIVAFSTESALPAGVLLRAINAHLPYDIAVTAVSDAPEDFNPRHDASSRLYRYLIWNRPVRSPFWKDRAAHVTAPLHEGRMNAAAQCLLGYRDFSAFVGSGAGENRHRRMNFTGCGREGDLITVELEGSGFMRQMVRSIVGTLIEVGRGAISQDEFKSIVDSGDRRRAGTTAPARGLYLAAVRYPDNQHVAGSSGDQI